ncbi:hypothetical protein [Mariprofundus sp. EBB-1]|uniref:hypothetical protein n=1 Tax=Mariprofundus sp. EBB-1 TaxID=2650971 RepID=UPI000EF19AF7|nr:hypothetical protein [Mariprofundus sp. EBB-1]
MNIGLGLLIRLRSFVLLLLCCICGSVVTEAETVDGAVHTRELVTQYLESRDALLQQFNKKPIHIRMSDKESKKDGEAQLRGLKALETQLRAIIAPVHIAGFKDDSWISLGSLRETSYGDASRLDGLFYSGDDGLLFVTTKELATHWLKKYRKPAEGRGMHDLQHDYSAFFALEAAVMPFMALPIQASKDVYIRATLALLGQDSGPYPPSVVYVYIERGDIILLLEHRLTEAISQVPACEKKYNASMNHGGLASHPWEPDAAFLIYKNCFTDKAESLPFYKPMIKEVQSIVDRIMRM